MDANPFSLAHGVRPGVEIHSIMLRGTHQDHSLPRRYPALDISKDRHNSTTGRGNACQRIDSPVASEASLLAQPQEASALHSRPLNTIEDRESV